jgi:hypothetical protein
VGTELPVRRGLLLTLLAFDREKCQQLSVTLYFPFELSWGVFPSFGHV